MAAQRIQDERSLGDLVSELGREVGRLVRDELQLAKTELRETARHATRSGAFIGAAVVLGLNAVMLLCFAIAWALDAALPTGLAFVAAAIVLSSVAAFLFSRGRAQMENVDVVPEETMRTLKEDLLWIRARAN